MRLSSKLSSTGGSLVTRHDPFHIHKTLGFCCLASFAVRLTMVGDNDMGFYSNESWSTLVTIGLHFLLSLSSLLFNNIPSKRISTGYRIWPEYRFHSIIFACRSFSCMTLIWTRANCFAISDSAYRMASLAIVLLTMAAADVASYSVGPQYHSNTIRDLHAPPTVRYYFSVMQFHGTTGCLLGSISGRYTTPFLFVLVIQVNAFLMTLRRKNMASHTLLLTVYGIMLATGFTLKSMEDIRDEQLVLAHVIANVAAVLRIGVGLNKYVLWTGLGILVQFVHLHGHNKKNENMPFLVILCAASYALVFCLGLFKSNSDKQVQKADGSASEERRMKTS